MLTPTMMLSSMPRQLKRAHIYGRGQADYVLKSVCVSVNLVNKISSQPHLTSPSPWRMCEARSLWYYEAQTVVNNK